MFRHHRLLCWILAVLLQVYLSESFQVFAPQQWRQHRSATAVRPALSASLNTAWEWLAEERLADGEEVYRDLEWIDPTNSEKDHTASEVEQSWQNIPIYPIPAVYLPTASVNHTLNNVEPRNLQMTKDLLQEDSNKLFCLVLRAADTGRIANVGTLMKLLDAEPQYNGDDLSRMVVTCVAVEPVTMDSLDNGEEAESRISRLKRLPIYLKGSVSRRRRRNNVTTNNIDTNLKAIVEPLAHNFAFVRSMYVDGIGQEEVPIFARDNIEKDLPPFQPIHDDASFWEAAYTWQKLCNTVREGRQIRLNADRNERMVETASQKGGPLRLPIHMEDLPPDVQQELQQMEVDRLNEFAKECRMDPILDFLVILQQPSLSQRIQQLASMVARERERLTQLALFGGSMRTSKESTEPVAEPQRKGAWFESGDFQ